MLVCFLPVLQNAFVAWDDDLNLTENPRYRGLLLAQLRWMFTTFLGGHYQPLSWVTLGLDYTLWGMNPTGYHLTNLVLHAANAVLLYLCIRRLLGPVSGDAGIEGAAVAGALFFAIHPLRVESVAWASERRDVLAGFFYLLTVLAYLRAVATGGPARRRWLALSLGCFVLSLLSKAWGVTLPVVLLLLDAYPLGRLAEPGARARVLLEKLPYAVLALGGAVLAFLAQEPVAAMRTLAEHGPLQRAAQAAYGLCFYLWKTVVPLGLSPIYLLELELDPAASRYVLSGVAVAAITVAAVLLRRRWPWLLVAWGAYVITVSPVLGFVQTGPQIAADRYTYLACLPWAVLFAAGIQRLRPLTVAAAGVLAVLGVLTFRQTQIWRDSRTLWEYVLRVDPANYIAYTNRGYTRDWAGDHDGAMADYTAAIRIHPGYPLAYYDRGTSRHARGDVDGAIADLSLAVQLNPRDPRYWNNRGWAREAKGDLAGAAADYAKALEVAPSDFPGRAKIEENLAFARARLGSRP